MIFTTVNE